jgi:hypothetical protein
MAAQPVLLTISAAQGSGRVRPCQTEFGARIREGGPTRQFWDDGTRPRNLHDPGGHGSGTTGSGGTSQIHADGEPVEAENHLREALGLFTKLGARWQIGRTLFALGELLRTRSREKAREYYSQALGAFEEIQAAPDAERTRLILNEVSQI